MKMTVAKICSSLMLMMLLWIGNIGRVVCVELTDKKQTKMKESWFPGLVVSPNAQVRRELII
jgi:hypothetical protein